VTVKRHKQHAFMVYQMKTLPNQKGRMTATLYFLPQLLLHCPHMEIA